MMVSSTFPVDRFEKERRVVLEELNQALNDPVDYLFETFQKEVFVGHPAEHLPIGSRETIDRISRETIVRFRDTYFVASNMVVVVVGNVRHEEVFPKLEAAFADLRQGSRPAFKAAPPPEPRARRVELAYNSEQAHVAFGLPLPAGYTHDDRFALEVANAILGGVGQRLFNVIVDEEGLASEVGSGYWQFTDVGVWVARASTDPETVDDVVELIGAELERLREEPLTDDELAAARGSLAGAKALAQESVGFQAEELSDGIALGFYTSVPDYVARIEAVTAADVQRVARQYLDPAKALVVVLRPE
jgi:predicted Zn-dependent peptidase